MSEIVLEVYGKKDTYEAGISLLELSKIYQDNERYDIVLAFVDGKLSELHKCINKDACVEFITTKSPIGNAAYRRSATLLMIKAFDEVMGLDDKNRIKVMYSLSKGYYCELVSDTTKLDERLLAKINLKMRELVDANLPINKETYGTDEVVKRFANQGMNDKERLFRYRRVSTANVYSIGDYEDYYYGYMVPSTSYVKFFELIPYETGFVLQMPVASTPNIVSEFIPQSKLFKVLRQSEDWGEKMDVDTVGALNDVIAHGGMNDLILVQEALMEKNIADLASRIVNENKKIVLIAGPSSSGKTTFSHRLSVQLRANGLKPHPIAMDNYFVDREKTPIDENGKYNFECIEALDVDTFNQNMTDLLEGKEVMMPTFNFQIGKREYLGNTLKLGKDDVLVIEGIHGLNPKMSRELPADSEFKIYISALTQLNIDEHNRIPTTDGRLIRRIVRDARTRGNSAQNTIAMWNSVRRGEEENIFPYQEEADAMFNSALIYELSVIKQYAEPLLFAIPKDAPEYIEAKRLLKFLDYFLGISGENIPNNSIIREFVGGGCFNL